MRRRVARVPLVMQMEALECGAACLAMVLGYYRKWLPLEQIRTDCGVSRDGCNARTLVLAAQAYGLETHAMRGEPIHLRSASFPCILHWQGNHFVVLCGFRGNRAVLCDPALGRIEISLEELDAGFTGVYLTFSPTRAFVAEGRPRSILQFARERLRGSMPALCFVSFTAALAALIGFVQPAFQRIFLDRLLPGYNPDWLHPFLMGMTILLCVQILLLLIRQVHLIRIESKFAMISSAQFFWHVLRLPIEFFTQRYSGDVARRMETNREIAKTLLEELVPVLLNLAMMLIYLIVLWQYSPFFTAIGLAALLANVLLMRWIAHLRVNVLRVKTRDEGNLASATVAAIDMMETTKANGAENGFFSQWAGLQASMNAADVRLRRLNSYLGGLPALVQSIASALVLAAGIWLVMHRHFSVGMLVAFQGFLSSFLSPMSSVLESGQKMQEMRADVERIDDVLRCEPDVSPTYSALRGKTEYDKLGGNIELSHVTFGYSRLASPLFQDFSLSIPRGSCLGVVGGSGCGKSTLARLISGLYSPWSGEILFDGRPRAEIPRAVFTSSLAVVSQEITLFEDTVAENIRLWDSSIEDFEVILAARDAHMHDLILQREGGYQSMVQENGKNFSGGERQRLEIARVLAQDPTILLLDEATSSLDTHTESMVMRSIHDRGITCVVVSHRLSTIRACDEILVLESGHLAEHGTHEQLMAQNGIYKRLVATE